MVFLVEGSGYRYWSKLSSFLIVGLMPLYYMLMITSDKCCEMKANEWHWLGPK
uniref:Uncharacterized protein n=1 Tax=Arundo donax TaxID=35708 RepID=A0A0A8ZDN9_ARUDO